MNVKNTILLRINGQISAQCPTKGTKHLHAYSIMNSYTFLEEEINRNLYMKLRNMTLQMMSGQTLKYNRISK